MNLEVEAFLPILEVLEKIFLKIFWNFLEKYEARILAPKLRTFVGDPNCGPSSTGSSQRSSPLSASPSPDLAVLACLHSPQYYQQQTQQNLTLLESQQRQSISTSSAASSIASGSSMATTTDARRLSTRLDDNLSPSASHGVGSGRRASGSRQSRWDFKNLGKNYFKMSKKYKTPKKFSQRQTLLKTPVKSKTRHVFLFPLILVLPLNMRISLLNYLFTLLILSIFPTSANTFSFFFNYFRHFTNIFLLQFLYFCFSPLNI